MTENNKIGIKETKEVLDFAFDLQKGITNSLKDGVINLKDLPNFMGLFISSPKAFMGINKVGAELLDLDEEEKEELMEYTRSRFDLPNDQIEMLIEDSIESVLNLVKLALRWSKNLKK